MRIGWVGTGRMGHALVTRLLAAGHDVAVYNRTRAKAEALGAPVVDSPADLADREVVFTMVSGSEDFKEVVRAVLAGAAAPPVLVDLTTVSPEASAEVRSDVAGRGVTLVAGAVSGNPSVVADGRATIVVSGPREAYDRVAPLLAELGTDVYAGEGEVARLAKICHNLLLGVIAQGVAEVAVLAEKGGMSREAFLDFLNASVLGSTFMRSKTPAYVNADFAPMFTAGLLRKDYDLGFAAARELDVPMPVTAAAQQAIQALVGAGRADEDFAALLARQAEASGLEL